MVNKLLISLCFHSDGQFNRDALLRHFLFYSRLIACQGKVYIVLEESARTRRAYNIFKQYLYSRKNVLPLEKPADKEGG